MHQDRHFHAQESELQVEGEHLGAENPRRPAFHSVRQRKERVPESESATPNASEEEPISHLQPENHQSTQPQALLGHTCSRCLPGILSVRLQTNSSLGISSCPTSQIRPGASEPAVFPQGPPSQPPHPSGAFPSVSTSEPPDLGFSSILHLRVPFPVLPMDLSFSLLPTAVGNLSVFQLSGFIHSGRSKEFLCSPSTGLHFLFVCFPESVLLILSTNRI